MLKNPKSPTSTYFRQVHRPNHVGAIHQKATQPATHRSSPLLHSRDTSKSQRCTSTRQWILSLIMSSAYFSRREIGFPCLHLARRCPLICELCASFLKRNPCDVWVDPMLYLVCIHTARYLCLNSAPVFGLWDDFKSLTALQRT